MVTSTAIVSARSNESRSQVPNGPEDGKPHSVALSRGREGSNTGRRVKVELTLNQ